MNFITIYTDILFGIVERSSHQLKINKGFNKYNQCYCEHFNIFPRSVI